MTAAAVAEKQPASPKGKTREELKSYAIFVFAFIFHFLVCKAASKAEATARLPKSRQIYPQLLSDYADFVGNIKLHAVVNVNTVLLVAADQWLLTKGHRVRVPEPYLLAGAAAGGWPALWWALDHFHHSLRTVDFRKSLFEAACVNALLVHITEAVAVYRIIVPRASGAKRPRDVPQQTIHPYFALWHQWGDSGAAFTLALAALRAAGWLALRYQRPQKAAEGAAGGAPEKAKAKEKEGNKKGSGSREAPLRRAGRLAANAVGALFPLSLLGALVVL